MNLAEQYRPQTWADVIGQDKTIAKLEQLRPRGLSGRAYWIAGKSGTGKTTIARLIAAECAAAHAIIEVDAGEVTAATIRDWQSWHRGRPIGSPGWAMIVNEAHGLRRDAIRALLVALEPIPEYVVWVFTTTSEGQDSLFEDQIDAHPLLSRCTELPLSQRDLARPFADRAMQIAEREGINGHDAEWYYKLAQKRKNNLRAMLQEIEAGN